MRPRFITIQTFRHFFEWLKSRLDEKANAVHEHAEYLTEEGAMPNATSTTAGAVKVEALGTETAPYTVPSTGKVALDLSVKVDKVTGKGLSTNDFTTAAQAKVNAIPANPKYTDTVTTINGKTGVIAKSDITALGIPAQDTVYTHPSTHPASMITQDSARRMVSDAQIAAWNGKQSKIVVSTVPPSGATGYAEGTIIMVIE